jgi:hypothetical protein
MKRNLYLSLFCIFTIFLVMACSITVNPGGGGNNIRGSGKVVTESRSVSGFKRVSLSGIGDLTLTQGNTESLEIEAEDNLIGLIESQVRGDTLYIGFKNNINGITPTKPVKYRLSVINLNGVEVSGIGNVSTDSVKTDNLDIVISGMGSIKIGSLEAQFLSVLISGTGNFEIAGKVDKMKVEISGAGSLHAGDLESKTADMQLSGAGNAKVWVTDSLDVVVSGAGSVEYYGKPVLSVQSSGAGQVKSLGEH